MFLPIGDSPNLPRTPWITWSLIAVNVLIYVLLWPLGREEPSRQNPVLQDYARVMLEERGGLPPRISHADLVRFEYGFKPGSPALDDALTAMFLHGGLMHLLGNMLFLWIFGDNVEHRLGRWRFLLAYLGTGFAATFGDALLRWSSEVPSVGASGAISGVLGMYFAWFPHNRVRVWVFLFPLLMNVVELPARFVLGAYVVIDNLLPLLLAGGDGGIAYGAHLGGFVAGWAGARIVTNEISHRRRSRPSSASAAAGSPQPLSTALGNALAERRLQDARDLLFDQPRARTRTELGPFDKISLAEALDEAGDARAALAVYQRALADHPLGPGRARAHLGAARVLLHRLALPTAAYQHFYAALEENPDPEDLATARRLRSELLQAAHNLPQRY